MVGSRLDDQIGEGRVAVTFQPTSRTKITPTPVRPRTLSRVRLLDNLREGIHGRVTLVIAEAGYGKTTLLADFSRIAGVHCLWYKLDAADRDWVTLLSYLVAAGREAISDFGAATSELLSQVPALNHPRERVLATFINELEALGNAPTVLILDDYHLANGSGDLHDVMSRLLRDGPQSLRFVILSRRPPDLPLARLRAQGEVTELDAESLRFSKEETERLFRDVYGRSLDGDVLDEIAVKTEGWAASLQLLHSSIRDRSAEDTKAFVTSLSGARGTVYDFLAEEILGEMTADMQRFLTRASLLERVVPAYVVALLGEDGDAPDEAAVERWMATAEALGFLGKRGETSTSRRFHPLLRDFFERQLQQRVDAGRLRGMHARVARAAESDDWLAACRHYIHAGEPEQAMRVLGRSALLALGTGSWGAASDILARLDGVELDPAVTVIAARNAMEAGDASGGIALLERLDVPSLSPLMRALVRQARMHGAWRNADSHAYLAALADLNDDPETPPPLRDIAEAYTLLGTAGRGAPLEGVANHLLRLATRQKTDGHSFFAAITKHNAMQLEVARAAYNSARALGEDALREFASTGRVRAESYSTAASLATCELELGSEREARRWIGVVSEATTQDADALAECMYTAAVVGWTEMAVELETRLDLPHSTNRVDLPGADSVILARAAVRLAAGDGAAAIALLERLPAWNVEPVTQVIRLTEEALARLVLGDRTGALRAATEGLALARSQGAVRWWARMDVARAAAEESPDELRHAIRSASKTGHLALLETAGIITERLSVFGAVPPEVTDSVGRWPDRWLPLLRRQLESGRRAQAQVAAGLLERHGTLYDVPRLRAFDRTYGRGGRLTGLGKGLARRASPILHVHDLGRTDLEVGHRSVALSAMRRKPASLLAYLITRPSMTATRELVLETLWPDLAPPAAANSLNQTLYFLRREIDPWYDDDVSADYVCFESELLWLDQHLVRVDSAVFMREARRLARSPAAESPDDVIALYRGRYSPEFEYEEWTLGYREKVHAAFLAFAHARQIQLIANGELRRAAELAQRVLDIDPDAIDVERNLIWLYASLGSRSAASEQYTHYAAFCRGEMGEEPATFDELVATPPAI